jgi:cyclic beta-1,2-glucan synthetase
VASDSCAAIQVTATLDRGQQTEVTFLLGQADNIETVRALLARYESPAFVDQALAATRAAWDRNLGALQVRTPVLSVNLLLNRWLLYQSLSCRFWGRSALYQSGGAFGFRDQLQDSMALVYAAPHLTRQHILAAAARQFVEGDVQHWWHPETGAGVRTRCSDDLLWLPYTAAQYIRVTGDCGILDEEVPFLEGPQLAPNEHEHMSTPAVSGRTAPLWEHCARAIDHSWDGANAPLGPHELPLIGNGDWNDGMNLVGAEGRGESVWLGWFLHNVLEVFTELLDDRRPAARLTAKWRQRAAALKTAIERSAWDGEWYLRAFFDDGSPLGSHRNAEAKIDSLPQSWAVISGAGDLARARRAMEAAEQHLVRERERLVLLFTPPFDHALPNPGYIMGYPPGLRENGGQYTHGSLWLAMAWARLGEGARAARLLQMMNPIELNRDLQDIARYRGEPYVVAADVSSAQDHTGQSGWTWYTGSAAWMYRIWIEEVLGLRVRGDHFTIEPSIPSDWDGFEMTYRRDSTVYEITVRRDNESSGISVEVDGRNVPAGVVPFEDAGGVRRVSVTISGPAPSGVLPPAHPMGRARSQGVSSTMMEERVHSLAPE